MMILTIRTTGTANVENCITELCEKDKLDICAKYMTSDEFVRKIFACNPITNVPLYRFKVMAMKKKNDAIREIEAAILKRKRMEQRAKK